MSDLTEENFELVRDIVYRNSAISLNEDMSYLVESRMLALLTKIELTTLDELFSNLKKRPEKALINQVVDAMTTNETSFFRDDHPFETFTKDLLPVMAEEDTGPINIWCAACSTGQEPFSIAIAISENCPELLSRVRIHATDISSDVLEKAKSGLYTRMEVGRGMPERLLEKYFNKVDSKWQVVNELRNLIDFDTVNLAGAWGRLPQMNVIFLRNVLIYFDTEVKSLILEKTIPLLKPNGCLFLGASETTLNLKTDYQRVSEGRSVYYVVKR